MDTVQFSFAVLLIPVISALIGWGTNWLAIKMTFQPLDYVGWRPIGWQGIIPAKAEKMAGKTVDLLTAHLINVKELFSRIDHTTVTRQLQPTVMAMARPLIDSAMRQQMPIIWWMMPDMEKKRLYRQAEQQLPSAVKAVMDDMADDITTIFDIRTMVVEHIANDKRLMNRLFWECGHKEFRFIEVSGLYFGFMFGLVQMCIWMWMGQWWLLPLGGLLVGYLTNWIALKLIFRPLRPVHIGPWVLQGLFIKRQAEVSEEYGKVVAHDILSARNIFGHALRNGISDRLAEIIGLNVNRAIDQAVGLRQIVLSMAGAADDLNKVKVHVAAEMIVRLPDHAHLLFEHMDRALDLENTLRDRLRQLAPEQYEGTLRPAFQEEEMTLILVGAALGGVAGCIQALLM
ncbi:MAG: DUF445 family protein [Flavobacteriales bacterium]|nr:DUF445 family protein [Flavobacteriales bacterium]